MLNFNEMVHTSPLVVHATCKVSVHWEVSVHWQVSG